MDESGQREAYEAAPLLESKRGNPNGDERVLAIGQTEAWVPSDCEKESAVAADVDELLLARTARKIPQRTKGLAV
jgi:hypothetical protein